MTNEEHTESEIGEASLSRVSPQSFAEADIVRAHEFGLLREELRHVASGGSSARFVVARHGDGKTSLSNQTRRLALLENFVVTYVHLSPHVLPVSSRGRAHSLYRHLTCTVSTQSKPSGQALQDVMTALADVVTRVSETSQISTADVLRQCLGSSAQTLHGEDFISVSDRYVHARAGGLLDEAEQALRWMRGEFYHRDDVRAGLGVTTLVDDGNWYAQLLMLVRIVRLAGYAGLLVTLDNVDVLGSVGQRARDESAACFRNMVVDASAGRCPGFAVVLNLTPATLKLIADRTCSGISIEPETVIWLRPLDFAQWRTVLMGVLRVCRAQDAGRNGWTDDVVDTFVEKNQGLRDGTSPGSLREIVAWFLRHLASL